MNVRIEGMIRERFEAAIKKGYSRLEVKNIMLGYLSALYDVDKITEEEGIRGIDDMSKWCYEVLMK